MKKLISLIVSMLLFVVAACSVQAAPTDTYTISLSVSPGDHVVVYDTNEVFYEDYYFDASYFQSELSTYSGHLFDAPVKKQAIQEANLRTGPGMQFDVVYQLVAGDVVNAVGEFNGTDCGWTWYLLDDGRYVSAHLLTDVNWPTEAVFSNGVKYDIYMFVDGPVAKTVINQQANVRSGPGIEHPIQYTLTSGNVVYAVGTIETIYSEWTWYILNDGNYVTTHLLE